MTVVLIIVSFVQSLKILHSLFGADFIYLLNGISPANRFFLKLGMKNI